MSDTTISANPDGHMTPRSLGLGPVIQAFKPVSLSQLIGTTIDLPSGNKVTFQDLNYYRDIGQTRKFDLDAHEYFHFVLQHFDDHLMELSELTVCFNNRNYTDQDVLELRRFLMSLNVMAFTAGTEVMSKFLGPQCRVAEMKSARQHFKDTTGPLIEEYLVRRGVEVDGIYNYLPGYRQVDPQVDPQFPLTFVEDTDPTLPLLSLWTLKLYTFPGEPYLEIHKNPGMSDLWIWVPARDMFRVGKLPNLMYARNECFLQVYPNILFDQDQVVEQVLKPLGWQTVESADELNFEEGDDDVTDYTRYHFSLTNRFLELYAPLHRMMNARLDPDKNNPYTDAMAFVLGMGIKALEKPYSHHFYTLTRSNTGHRSSEIPKYEFHFNAGLGRQLCLAIKTRMTEMLDELAITLRDLIHNLDKDNIYPNGARQLNEDLQDLFELKSDLDRVTYGLPVVARLNVYRKVLIQLMDFWSNRMRKHRFFGPILDAKSGVYFNLGRTHHEIIEDIVTHAYGAYDGELPDCMITSRDHFFKLDYPIIEHLIIYFSSNKARHV